MVIFLVLIRHSKITAKEFSRHATRCAKSRANPQGTNAEEGAKIIQESGLKVYSAILLKDAAQKVKDVLKG